MDKEQVSKLVGLLCDEEAQPEQQVNDEVNDEAQSELVVGEITIIELDNPLFVEFVALSPDSDWRFNSKKEYIDNLAKLDKSISTYQYLSALVELPLTKDRPTYMLDLDEYEKLLLKLFYRPPYLRMGLVNQIDELKTFCAAVMIGWRFFRHNCIGLRKIIEYLAEDTLIEDIQRMERPFLVMLKDIVLWRLHPGRFDKRWKIFQVQSESLPLPELGSGVLGLLAKKIIVRYQSGEDYDDETDEIDDDDDEEEIALNQFMKSKMFEYRKICEAEGCLEIEENRDSYAHCSKCKTAYYCSRKCQRQGWRDGHKHVCSLERAEIKGMAEQFLFKNQTSSLGSEVMKRYCKNF